MNSVNQLPHSTVINKIENKNIFRSMKFENYILDFLLSNSVIGQDYYPRINKSIENILSRLLSKN